MIETSFEPGLLGQHCWLEFASGERISLATERWWSTPSPGDELLLRHCVGPTLDIGCGPGRLTAALTERGVIALGTDISPVAVRVRQFVEARTALPSSYPLMSAPLRIGTNSSSRQQYAPCAALALTKTPRMSPRALGKRTGEARSD